MILQYPHPTLKKKAVKVDPTASLTHAIVTRLKKIMKNNQSVGLAAPQIGISKRIAVADAVIPPEIIVLINPVVLRRENLMEVGEGCLSLQSKGTYLAKRPNRITFKNQTLSGKTETLIRTGKFANIIDHEIDHLNGICGGRK